MFTAQGAALNKVASRNVLVPSPAWKWMIVPGQRWAKRSRS